MLVAVESHTVGDSTTNPCCRWPRALILGDEVRKARVSKFEFATDKEYIVDFDVRMPSALR